MKISNADRNMHMYIIDTTLDEYDDDFREMTILFGFRNKIERKEQKMLDPDRAIHKYFAFRLWGHRRHSVKY